MKDDSKYMIFRIYSKEERPYTSQRERIVFYGWSKRKNVVKAFLEQRDKNKYKMKKMSEEDIAAMFSEDVTDMDTMIDFIKLKSVRDHKEYTFFSTANELRSAEVQIQEMMRDLCSLSDIPGDGNYLGMILSLDNYYGDALYYIGYRPPEVDILFPSNETYSKTDSSITEIDMAYDGLYAYPEEVTMINEKPMGLVSISDTFSKVLYSLESFVKVLRDEL